MNLYSPEWVIVPVVLPLLAALATFVMGQRILYWLAAPMLTGYVLSLVALTLQLHFGAPLRYAVAGWGAPLGIDLYLDGLSLLMLWLSFTVGILVSVYARGYFRHSAAQSDAFWPLWLLLWCGLNALFLSADIFNLYVTLEMITLSSVPLIVLATTAAALAGAMRYLMYALLGSLTYLLGVALIYAEYGNLDIETLGLMLQPSLLTLAAIALLFVGLMIKTALFPLHFWLPIAHSSAPAPVSAILSALVVKASFYLMLRLGSQMLPDLLTPAAAQFAGLLGAAAIIYGSVQALRQTRLKLLIAYSTVAQLGYLLLVFPLGYALSLGAVTLHALSHGLAKAAMFLAAGNVMLSLGHDRIAQLGQGGKYLSSSLFAFGLAGVAIIGLPPSGGFLGKWLMLQAANAEQQWWWMAIIIAGGLLAAGYIFRVLGAAFRKPRQPAKSVTALPLTLTFIPLILATLSLLLGFMGMPLLSFLNHSSTPEVIL